MTKESNYSNDNEPDFWSSIGLQAAMILNKLRVQAQLEEQPVDWRQRNRREGNENGKDSADSGSNVDERFG